MKNNEAIILGVMSGTSLDGLDFALCKFQKDKDAYSFSLLKTGFVSYEKEIKTSLSNAQNLNAFDFIKLHKQYGKYIGKKINTFLKNEIKPDFIASHGHTIFHKPNENITFQIGDAAFIVAETDISVISDFRNLDTALKGQGAPLVPVGDKYLFHKYDFCINLGGFANASYDNKKGERIAFDICPINFIINSLVKSFGKEFDKDGKIGKTGSINIKLLEDLNNIPFYFQKAPKSLGREYAEKYFYPLLANFNIPDEDKIRTFYRHIAVQIAKVINTKNNSEILITGGGAHNKFLISEIESEIHQKVIIPDKETIDFKEAIIFAFLGYLRINKSVNALKFVTGAIKDNIGGSIFITKT
ncbi:MAG: anhydro-N-acetylmuramic acid kinase [Bacteroidales bacterium]|nr:anhydro-N-acetylmuramic acid kinase [Bacteroidales bacterium]